MAVEPLSPKELENPSILVVTVYAEIISVPGVKELPLTLECKVVYKQKQDMAAMTEENRAKFYPQDVDSLSTGANKDTHVAYYGEIVNAYVIE